jgi:hypothetical protein
MNSDIVSSTFLVKFASFIESSSKSSFFVYLYLHIFKYIGGYSVKLTLSIYWILLKIIKIIKIYPFVVL